MPEMENNAISHFKKNRKIALGLSGRSSSVIGGMDHHKLKSVAETMQSPEV